MLKIIHFSEKYHPIRDAGLDLSQKNYERQYIFKTFTTRVYVQKTCPFLVFYSFFDFETASYLTKVSSFECNENNKLPPTIA